jgi:hypothetical protein
MQFSIPEDWIARISLIAIAGICLITFLLAIFAAPNTWDSLTYHMSRVAHWAQNRSLGHFATGIERQNLMSPGAELLVLQGYVLWGGDRLANLVQWTSMVLSLVGVSLITKDLGGSYRAQVFAGLFASTFPMGIAQASSTMTDYTLAFWLVLLACETVHLMKNGQGQPAENYLYIGLATGLAVLTKPTAFAYLAPFAIWILIWFLKSNAQKLAVAVVVVVLSILFINSGYLTRNYNHYGNPIGPGDRFDTHGNEIMDWRVLVSNVLRNASLHAGTYNDKVNDFTYLMLAKVHWKLDLPLNDPRTSVHPEFRIFEPNTSENWTGNTLHAAILLLSFPFALYLGRKNKRFLYYSLVVAAGFLVLSVMIKFTIFGSRYHTPFFVLSAPSVALVLGRFSPNILLPLGSLTLVLASRMWLFELGGRSFDIAMFTTPREDRYLSGELETIYRNMTDRIDEQGCDRVGIMISGNYPEYPLWVYLGAPSEDLEIEWIIGENDTSSDYRKVDFEPCALICQYCPEEWETFRDMPEVFVSGDYRLFLEVGLGFQPGILTRSW